MDGCCQWILLSGAPRGVIPNALTRALTKRDADFLELLQLVYLVLSVLSISAFCLMEFTNQEVVPAQLV